MNAKNFRQYLDYLKRTGDYSVSEQLLEKDYLLSKFLSELQQCIESGKVSEVKNLIFKGGTLLTKNYLAYHRISEDLDFTHDACNRIRALPSASRREHAIKPLIIELIREIKIICDGCGLDFEISRTNQRYVQVRNSRAVYVLTLHYTSLLHNTHGTIKLEINFVENLINKPTLQKINNIADAITTDAQYLRAVGYDLQHANLLCYSLDEIILEKCRATLTRKEIKERDIFDLFLINGRQRIFDARPQQVREKLDAASLVNRESARNLKRNFALIVANTIKMTEDIDVLALHPYDKQKYQQFKQELFAFLVKICRDTESH